MQLFAATKGSVFSTISEKITWFREPWKKYRWSLRIMKIIAFLVLIINFQVSAKVSAQESITLKEKGASLFKIFTEIKKQTGYNFFVSGETIQNAKPIDIEVKNASLKQVLDICFKGQPLSYTITGKTIVISIKKNEPHSEQNVEYTSLINLKGKVLNEKGEPISGATLSIQGSTKSTVTNSKGEFSMSDVNGNAVLIITCVGYESRLINIDGRNIIDAVLQIKITSLDELQVIAYGTTTKRLNTGNVTTVKSADIEKQPVSNPLLALEGRVPGMFITQTNGLPGAGVKVEIRGQNSILNGNYPLYIIDGVPYSSQSFLASASFLGTSISGPGGALNNGSPFNYINPADIESIDVLKDADATAIYGSRGANGVVLITTKKGSVGKLKLEANIQNGWGTVPRKMHVLNTQQYLEMRHEAFKNDGATPNPSSDFDLTLWDTTRSTDWQKVLIGGKAVYKDAQINLSGGNSNTQFLIGLGYHKETTVFPDNENDRKASAHFYLNSSSLNQKFKVQFSGNFMANNNHLSGWDFTQLALQLPPDAPPLYNQDGSLNWAPSPSGASSWPKANPAARLLEKYQDDTYNLISNLTTSYNILKDLEFKSSFGFSFMQTNELQTVPLLSYDPFLWPSAERRSWFAYNKAHSWIIEPQILYRTNILKGKLSALIGGTIQESINDQLRLIASGFNSDLVLEDPQAATSVIPSNSNLVYKYNAAFGRVNYNWDDKYQINITARRDGSSRFGPANQFHNFGAVGLAWIFSKEKFFQENLPLISFGKVRASYGTTGNDQVGDYTFMDLYTTINTGVLYQGSNGAAPSRIFTPDLSWEETRKFEGGVALGFLNDRIFIEASFYRNRSSNQLLNYSLPSITGFTSVQKNLNALVENSGLEMDLKTVNIKTKSLKWTTALNFTLNRNKLVSGASGLSTYYQNKIGHPLYSTSVYHFAGVDPITGLYQVTDVHGNTTNAPNFDVDANVLIDLTPKFYGGIQNSISYKGLQIDMLFQFVRQPMEPIYMYNFMPGSFNSGEGTYGSNQPIWVLNRWQRPGDVAMVQRFSQNYSTSNAWLNAQNSNLVYGDASFIRLKNASLNYQIPEIWRKNLNVQNLIFFVQGQNLLTITRYKGLDPETKSSTTLPPLRVITFGIRLGL